MWWNSDDVPIPAHDARAGRLCHDDAAPPSPTRRRMTVAPSHNHRGAPRIPYVVEGLTSISTSALSVAIFFYANRYFGWGLLQNFLLATGQGAGYTLGALATEP